MANPKRAGRIVLISSAVGFPPFFVTPLLAGAMRMDVVRFVVAGSVGRLIHFGAFVVAGDLVVRLF